MSNLFNQFHEHSYTYITYTVIMIAVTVLTLHRYFYPKHTSKKPIISIEKPKYIPADSLSLQNALLSKNFHSIEKILSIENKSLSHSSDIIDLLRAEITNLRGSDDSVAIDKYSLYLRILKLVYIKSMKQDKKKMTDSIYFIISTTNEFVSSIIHNSLNKPGEFHDLLSTLTSFINLMSDKYTYFDEGVWNDVIFEYLIPMKQRPSFSFISGIFYSLYRINSRFLSKTNAGQVIAYLYRNLAERLLITSDYMNESIDLTNVEIVKKGTDISLLLSLIFNLLHEACGHLGIGYEYVNYGVENLVSITFLHRYVLKPCEISNVFYSFCRFTSILRPPHSYRFDFMKNEVYASFFNYVIDQVSEGVYVVFSSREVVNFLYASLKYYRGPIDSSSSFEQILSKLTNFVIDETVHLRTQEITNIINGFGSRNFVMPLGFIKIAVVSLLGDCNQSRLYPQEAANAIHGLCESMCVPQMSMTRDYKAEGIKIILDLISTVCSDVTNSNNKYSHTELCQLSRAIARLYACPDMAIVQQSLSTLQYILCDLFGYASRNQFDSVTPGHVASYLSALVFSGFLSFKDDSLEYINCSALLGKTCDSFGNTKIFTKMTCGHLIQITSSLIDILTVRKNLSGSKIAMTRIFVEYALRNINKFRNNRRFAELGATLKKLNSYLC